MKLHFVLEMITPLKRNRNKLNVTSIIDLAKTIIKILDSLNIIIM